MLLQNVFAFDGHSERKRNKLFRASLAKACSANYQLGCIQGGKSVLQVVLH